MTYHLFQNSIWKVVKIAKTSDITLVGDTYFLPPLYIPQKKAENIYKTDSARKNKIFGKKKGIFFNFFNFSRHARGPPKIFDVQFSKNFQKKFKK